MPLRMAGHRKDHHARCVTVEPVDQQRIGKRRLYARYQTIGQMRPLAWHRQQAGRLVHKDHFMVEVQHL